VASTHAVFVPPTNQDERIWRYMDFTKFVWMLAHSALYFSRSDLLGDPFEGSTSRPNKLLLSQFLKEQGMNEMTIQQLTADFASFRKWIRSWIFVNCWHMNEQESAAMWRLYARTNEAIAIQSTYAKLFDVLPPDTYVGVVHYIDYERGVIPESNAFYSYLYKRKSFEHEREIRAVLMDLPHKEGDGLDMEREQTEAGKVVPVNLDALIENIYVAPTSPSWFKELVEALSNKYGVRKNVVQSALDWKPIY
jgi:hypothetical protein